eukprot:11210099-Lingulodinium_polyedra.AAC.1
MEHQRTTRNAMIKTLPGKLVIEYTVVTLVATAGEKNAQTQRRRDDLRDNWACQNNTRGNAVRLVDATGRAPPGLAP